MIIVNADDWGRSVAETEAALSCYREGQITSVTAMMFMADSERAAELAGDGSFNVGLHLNLSESFSARSTPGSLKERHGKVARFLTRSRYAPLLYNPVLDRDFRYLYEAQIEEFVRLYRRSPTHIDGHQHQHLCANMLLGKVIPAGQKVRRTFYFWPGERGLANRAYRSLVNRLLRNRYEGAEYFFALSQCFDEDRLKRVAALARESVVEVMTHPVNAAEREFLFSETFHALIDGIERGAFGDL